MTEPDRSDDSTPALDEGTDVTIDDADDSADTPATSNPDEMTDDGDMGGTGGRNPGGAG